MAAMATRLTHLLGHAGVTQHRKVMVQAHRMGNDLRQAPGSGHDGTHHGVVGAVRGVFGLDKGAVLARHGFDQRAAVARTPCSMTGMPT